MTKFTPIFPLNLVVYPGQQLNLHIFEPRYIQLIRECLTENKTFAIPAIVGSQPMEYGTEMQLLEVSKTYPNGTMDIKTKGTGIVRVVELIKSIPDKLYSGAIVFIQPHLPFDTTAVNPTLLDLLKKLHVLLGTGLDTEKKFANALSYDLAQYAALSLEDQYRLLSSSSERGRQWFLIQHLQRLIAEVENVESFKSKVRLNGHFRHENPPSF